MSTTKEKIEAVEHSLAQLRKKKEITGPAGPWNNALLTAIDKAIVMGEIVLKSLQRDLQAGVP